MRGGEAPADVKIAPRAPARPAADGDASPDEDTGRSIAAPYLLFVGDAPDPGAAKTATGIAHWRPEDCAGQLRLPGGVDLGLPDMDVPTARAAGVRTLVVGLAPFGGVLPETWVAVCREALEAGLDVAGGLHTRLGALSPLREAAARSGARIHDVREPPVGLAPGTGRPRPGRRLLTVGTDCAVGKMFAALAIERELRARDAKATFRATGQTGILIAGGGVPIDAVVSDFVSGAVEALAPANACDHWDVIEGQGSLHQPAYAGVSLGLLHGAQADALIVCHEVGRVAMDDLTGYEVPGIEETAALNLALARRTNPAVRWAGVSLNTSRMDKVEALATIDRLGRALPVPVVDPVRTGVGPIVDDLLNDGDGRTRR